MFCIVFIDVEKFDGGFMDLARLERLVRKSFEHYQLASSRCAKTITPERPIGSWVLVAKSGHRAGRYLNLRKKLESLGGRFGNQEPLK